MNPLALAGLSCCVAVLIAVAVGYLVRVERPRPPVGVYVPADIAVLCVGVVLAPLLYLNLPAVAVSVVFGLVMCLAVQFTLAPVTGTVPSWCIALAATGATVAAAVLHQPVAVRACTDVVLCVAVVGVACLWAQGGMRSAHVAALAAVLTCYDLVATSLTDVTVRLFTEVQGRPFAPLLALTGGAQPVAVGLGDLLLLILFPLVAAKAYGRAAAWLAAGVGVLVTSVVSLLFWYGVLTTGFPLLTALGPLIVVQHLLWNRRTGGERTTEQWRAGAAPRVVRPDRRTPDPVVAAALATAVPDGLPDGSWLAIADGRVVGTGAAPGLARRDARRHGTDGPLLVRQV